MTDPTILYFDTALSGRYRYRDPDDSPVQPHLCRLALRLVRGEEALDEFCALIKPKPGWNYDIDQMVGHGVLPADARERGRDIRDVVNRFETLRAQADLIAAFNYDHHRRVLLRSGYDCDVALELPGLRDRKTFCLMRESTEILRKPRSGGGLAWPKFAEAVHYFDREPFPLVPDAIQRGIEIGRALQRIHQGIIAERQP